MNIIEELRKACQEIQGVGAELLRKSQLGFDFGTPTPNPHANHKAYTRTNARGTVSQIKQKGTPIDPRADEDKATAEHNEWRHQQTQKNDERAQAASKAYMEQRAAATQQREAAAALVKPEMTLTEIKAAIETQHVSTEDFIGDLEPGQTTILHTATGKQRVKVVPETAQTGAKADLMAGIEKVAADMMANPLLAEYRQNIQRKVDALKKNPTAKNAIEVANDLQLIAKTAQQEPQPVVVQVANPGKRHAIPPPSPSQGGTTMTKAQEVAKQIKKTKGTSAKDKIYLSHYGAEREGILKEIILGLPPRSYTLDPRNHAPGDSLQETVGATAGVFAETDVNQRLLAGMAVAHPERIKVSFTLGLDEVTILPPQKGQKKTTPAIAKPIRKKVPAPATPAPAPKMEAGDIVRINHGGGSSQLGEVEDYGTGKLLVRYSGGMGAGEFKPADVIAHHKPGSAEHASVLRQYNPHGLKQGQFAKDGFGNRYMLLREPNSFGDVTAISAEDAIRTGGQSGVGHTVKAKYLEPIPAPAGFIRKGK